MIVHMYWPVCREISQSSSKGVCSHLGSSVPGQVVSVLLLSIDQDW